MKRKRRPDPTDADLKAWVVEHREDIGHALWCERCNLRGNALVALRLVGWTEEEFVAAVQVRTGQVPADG